MKPLRYYTLPSNIRWGGAFRSLSPAARALYADLEAIANEQSGVLQVLGTKLGIAEIATHFFRGDVGAAHACMTELIDTLGGIGIISRRGDGVFVLDFIEHACNVRESRAAGGGKSVLNPAVPRAKSGGSADDGLTAEPPKPRQIASVTAIRDVGGAPVQSDFFSERDAPPAVGAIFAQGEVSYAAILCGGTGVFRPEADTIRFAFPVKGGELHVGVTESKVVELANMYGLSELEVSKRLSEARQWADDHRMKRDGKTASRMNKFILSWVQSQSTQSSASRRPLQPSDGVRDVFDFWVRTMQPDSTQSVLDRQRAGVIQSAIALGYTVESLKKAIAGCHRSDFHMGKNDQNTKFNALSVIFNGADRIEKFIALADAPAECLSRSERELQGTIEMLNDWASSCGKRAS